MDDNGIVAALSVVEAVAPVDDTHNLVISNAVRSFGVISWVEPKEFQSIVERQDEPVVITSTEGLVKTEYRYLVSYKGLAFFTKSPYQLELSPRAEIVRSRKLLLPG